MTEHLTASAPTIFDQKYYVELIETRGETIRRVVPELKRALGLSTALDAGCGLGFFTKTLRDCALDVLGIDGRPVNTDEARRRYPELPFENRDVEDPSITDLGSFDLILCFGLLYHLENPLRSIRHLRSLTAKVLLLESMCVPSRESLALLREEPKQDDQSLTDLAFYPSESCMVKMLYRAGFSEVYRVAPLPNHDDFRETPSHFRRRTILCASLIPLKLPSLVLIPEPLETRDPWRRDVREERSFVSRTKAFLSRSTREKYWAIHRRVIAHRFRNPNTLRLWFGCYWLPEGSALDDAVSSGSFEPSESSLVSRLVKPGMTVVDVGAHHGFYTLLASRNVGSKGRVLAFEPSPRERTRLEKHVRVNRCKNVSVYPFAVGSANAVGDLFLVESAEDYCNSLRPPAVAATTRKIQVEVVSLDEFLKRAGVHRVHFIKLDVEGAELDVLQGAQRTLETNPRPTLLVEVFDVRTRPWGYRAKEIVRFLYAAGYDWFSIRGDGTIQAVPPNLESYDANLVAIPK